MNQHNDNNKEKLSIVNCQLRSFSETMSKKIYCVF